MPHSPTQTSTCRNVYSRNCDAESILMLDQQNHCHTTLKKGDGPFFAGGKAVWVGEYDHSSTLADGGAYLKKG